MEKNRFIDDNGKKECSDDNNMKLVKLDRKKLLYEIKRKDILLGSLPITCKNIHDTDDDIDEDNFKRIKNYHIEIGLQSIINNIKLDYEPRYISKYLKPKTLEKYKAYKGTYLGPSEKN